MEKEHPLLLHMIFNIHSALDYMYVLLCLFYRIPRVFAFEQYTNSTCMDILDI